MRFFAVVVCLLLCGCTVGFSNSQRQVSTRYSKIYLPSVVDATSYGGQAARLSMAVRSLLAKRTDIEISSLEEARLAVTIKILQRNQTVTMIDDCINTSTKSTQTVANGAILCGNQNFQTFNLSLPQSSPSQESLSLIVRVKAIDLNSGQTLWIENYNDVPPVFFSEIGDIGGITIAELQYTPELHALRYQEAMDSAVQKFSEIIAEKIASKVFILSEK